MDRIPSTSALLAFESAARLLSVKNAAEELNLTAGAVSRQVQALEEMLGVPLFRRSHRKVELTAAGAAYFAEIAPPMAALRAAGARARAMGRSPVVSIVSYPTFAVRWLIPRWSRFLDAHPEIDLRLTTSLNPIDFARGDADLAIHVVDPRRLPPDAACRKLMEVNLYPVASPAVAAGLKRPADLAQATLIHHAPRPADWPRWLAECGVDGVNASAGLRFESQNLALQAAIEGLGVAIAFDAVAGDDLAAGRLVRPFEATRRSSRPIYLIEPRPNPPSPERATVRDWIVAEAERS